MESSFLLRDLTHEDPNPIYTKEKIHELVTDYRDGRQKLLFLLWNHLVNTVNSTKIPVDRKSGFFSNSANWWRCLPMAFRVGGGYMGKSLSIYEDPTKTSGPLDMIFIEVSSIETKKLGPRPSSNTRRTWLTDIILSEMTGIYGNIPEILRIFENKTRKNGIGVLPFCLI